MSGNQRIKASQPSLADLLYSDWRVIVALIAAGGTPDVRRIAALLRKGEPVPPEVQTYLADLLTRKRQAKRPKQPQFQIESERQRKAFAFIKEIKAIQSANKCKLAAAYAIFSKTHRAAPASVKRRYLAATKTINQLHAEAAAIVKQAAQQSGVTEKEILRRMQKTLCILLEPPAGEK
ncbi:MAG: hypothetical protein WA615_28825 [Bradyrhizobium sp.]|uniref:hypothetical protein n=1 Tax=Bradyrhizobium sp. TaxID=376 RepID=UPI003C79CA42